MYLSPFGLCGFYYPCIRCLNEYLPFWDIEPLVLMAGFYCLLMVIRLLVLKCYSLVVLGMECLLWLRLSLMSIRYVLH